MAGDDARLASGRLRALSTLALLLTEAPWLVQPAEIEALRRAGVSEEGVEQAISVAAFFNYFPRVADATGIAFDYDSPLPRLAIEHDRAAQPRPPRAEWSTAIDGSALPRLPHRPATEAALAPWRAHVLDRDTHLSSRDRRVLARAAAAQLCDAGAVERWAEAAPRSARDEILVAYADKLTLTPWAMTSDDLRPLRALGLDDADLLGAICVVAQQNALSRFHHALAAARG